VEGREVSPQKSVTTTVPTRNSWTAPFTSFDIRPIRTVISNDRCNFFVSHCNLWSIAPPTNHPSSGASLGLGVAFSAQLFAHTRDRLFGIEGQAACYHVGRTATIVVNSLGHTRRRAFSADARTRPQSRQRRASLLSQRKRVGQHHIASRLSLHITYCICTQDGDSVEGRHHQGE